MISNSRHAKAGAHGFTLIEVLIAILILALGILGLGAVFPVVIAQQRDAVQTVDGEGIASMIEAILGSSGEVIDFSPKDLLGNDLPISWFHPSNNFGKDDTANANVRGEWVVRQSQGDTTYQNWPDQPGHLDADYATGIWVLNQTNPPNPNDPNELSQLLTVADRLFPQPYSGKDPKYVWDIVARRQPVSNRPQIGIFIRNVDARIRVPNDATLSDVLVTGTAGNDPLLPVAIDLTSGKPGVDTGAPTMVYAAIQTLQVQVRQEHLDWLIFEDADNILSDTSISFATQPGQKLLDNTGTVRTVLGPPDNDPDFPILQDPSARIVRVDPPFRLSQAVDSTGGLDSSANEPTNGPTGDAERASWVRQIVFTPRTPVAIRVITLEEPTQ